MRRFATNCKLFCGLQIGSEKQRGWNSSHGTLFNFAANLCGSLSELDDVRGRHIYGNRVPAFGLAPVFTIMQMHLKTEDHGAETR